MPLVKLVVFSIVLCFVWLLRISHLGHLISIVVSRASLHFTSLPHGTVTRHTDPVPGKVSEDFAKKFGFGSW